MSKRSQEAALKAYPNRMFVHERTVYRFGFEHAEKVLKLKWQDVKRIVEIADHLCPYTSKEIAVFKDEFQTEEAYYKEVLKRFNEARDGREPEEQ